MWVIIEAVNKHPKTSFFEFLSDNISIIPITNISLIEANTYLLDIAEPSVAPKKVE